MTTEAIIIHLFCAVDDGLKEVPKEPLAKLHPSEVVTIGILFALRGGYFRAFERWLRRDYSYLFGGLPDRSTLLRQLRRQQQHTDLLLADAGLLCVLDTLPMELLFPIRQGRSPQQLGQKGKDKGRWSVGIKLAWVINRLGQVCGWRWDSLNCHDQQFLPLAEMLAEQSVVLADYGFRCAQGVPNNLKLCEKGTWNERMKIETVFSMLTVVADAKPIHHRVEQAIDAHLAYLAAMFNVCLRLFHSLYPEVDSLKLSIAEFSL